MAAPVVAQRKVSVAGFVVYIILFLALLAVNGLANFVIAKFDVATILTATYWLKTVTGSASGLFAFIIFALMRRDVKVVKDEQYNKDLTDLNAAIAQKVGPDFPAFTAAETRQNKKDAYIMKMQNKLSRWNKRVPARVLAAKAMIERNDEKFLKSRNLFKVIRRARANRWIRRLNDLNLRKSPEWLEQNIDYVKIKHMEITPGEIINGERGVVSTKFINNNAIGVILQNKIPMILLTTALQAAYNALNILEATSSIEMWLGIIVQLVSIFMNVGFGLAYGDTLFKMLDCNNLLNRKNYIMKYLLQHKG